MIRKLTAMLAAFAFAGAALAPVAEARDRDGYRGHRGGHYDNYRGRHHRGDYYRRDHGDAVAAGAVGLILGLALGSLASEPRGGCYDRCAPPPRCYDRCRPPPPPPSRCSNRCGGYDDGYYEQRYDPRYDDRRGTYYEEEYGLDGGRGPQYRERSECTRSERQWDRYAQRYVTVDVPC